MSDSEAIALHCRLNRTIERVVNLNVTRLVKVKGDRAILDLDGQGG